MPRRGKGGGQGGYSCPDPPCIHLVVDERRRLVKAFFEDGEYITPLPLSVLRRACRELARLESSGGRLREAEGSDVDYLARRYLEASPVEEEEEEIVEE